MHVSDSLDPSFSALAAETISPTKKSKSGSVIEIWSKAAIGLYLWQHIFEGPLHLLSPGWSSGEILANQLLFRFHTGPQVTLETVSQDVSDVILVLNGREQSKIEFASDWLDYVTHSPELNSVGVILLGNEQCSNAWIRKYMKTEGGPIKYLFVVYDAQEVDNKVTFQWPLGVATYRNFPVVSDKMVDLVSPRKYLCNFAGTIYPNSSREILLEVLRSNHLLEKCFVKERLEWEPKETTESLNSYITALQDSDLTLNPVGMNAECYRIYEAMSFGSVPVIEDRPGSETCGGWNRNRSAVLRLLKRHRAPVIYIDDWKRLPELLKNEATMTREQTVARRLKLVEWYAMFRRKMRDRLVDLVWKNL